jgi:hypothetical protein
MAGYFKTLYLTNTVLRESEFSTPQIPKLAIEYVSGPLPSFYHAHNLSPLNLFYIIIQSPFRTSKLKFSRMFPTKILYDFLVSPYASQVPNLP